MKTLSLMLVNILLILTISTTSACGQVEVNCDNYETQIVKKFDSEHFNGGKDISYGKQQKEFTLADFFDSTTLKGVRSTTCKEKKTERAGCWGTPFVVTIYANDIIVERGEPYDWILLHHNFPTTPNGISPGATKVQVKNILGPAQWEMENYLQYKLIQAYDYNPENTFDTMIAFYFIDNKLSLISFIDAKDECVE